MTTPDGIPMKVYTGCTTGLPVRVTLWLPLVLLQSRAHKLIGATTIFSGLHGLQCEG